MAYATYTTEAVVCGSRDAAASDRSVLLFTERAGMVWAAARGAREERSRQRYALCDFSLVRVSLIRGKSGWRIGSVEALANPYWQAAAREARGGLRDVVGLLRRFVHGEEPNPAVYQDVRVILAHLPHLSPESVSSVLDHFQLRLLTSLGYIAPHPAYQAYLDQAAWWKAPTPLPSAAYAAIRQAITASHL